MPAKTKTRSKASSKTKGKTANTKAVMMYCLKCKQQTETKNVEATTMKNGSPATRGVCAVCDTQKYRIGAVA